MNLERRLLIEQGGPGHRGPSLPECDVPLRPLAELLPGASLREKLAFPEVSEPEVVRHFVELSTLNHHIDKGLYPLGSCTMKHNPKLNDEIAALPGFALSHPLASDEASQGSLAVIRELQKTLAEITGFHAVTTQPAAGAHGELCGMMTIRAALTARALSGSASVPSFTPSAVPSPSTVGLASGAASVSC